jgi:cytochrome P450
MRDPVKFCEDAARKHGEVVRLNFGVFEAFLLWHPDHLKYVLQENSQNFGKGKIWDATRRAVGSFLVNTEGAYWLRTRRIMQPAFHRERLAVLAADVAQVTEARVNAWVERRGEPIDVYVEMKRITRDVVLRALFSTSLRDDEMLELEIAVPIVMDGLTTLMWAAMMPKFIPVGLARVRRARQTIEDVVGRILAERRAEGPKYADLLAMLLEARDEETGEGLTDEQLREEIIGMFLAAYESSSVALAWAFFALSKHRDEGERVFVEARDALSRPVDLETLSHLQYTRRFFEETMRVYPPGWLIPRQAMAEDRIGGFRIPAKAILLLNNQLTHRHEGSWPKPDLFDPDRFLPEASKARHRFAFAPFGGGPRGCVGLHLAMMEGQLILASAARRFRFEVAAPFERKAVHVMLQPRPALKMKLIPRA